MKFDIAAPSLSDCLDGGGEVNSGLAIKGTLKCVSK